jgi:hypothetical protein
MVAATTLGVFLAVLALLVFQLRSGHDPALGRGTALAGAPLPPPRHVLVRRVVVTRVVVHLPEEADDSPVALAAAPAVVSQYTAPAAPPVTSVAPAPAPAPAPLTTRTS